MRPALLLLTLLAAPAGAQVSGPARVIDGDSIVVAGQMVRLEGLDAPEMTQHCHRREPPRPWPCGRVAAAELRRFIDGRPVTCEGVVQPDGGVTDRYGRLLGICSVGGVEINGWLVESGLALAFIRYTDRYVAHEARARAAGRGMWAGPFMRPEEWRAAKRGGR